MFRNELLLKSKKLNGYNDANVKTAYLCHNCDNKFPSCAVCFRSVTVLNSMYEFKKRQITQNSSQ